MFRFVAAPRSSSAGTNNLPPLTFHQVHGDNIRLCNGGTIARRHESFCKGVTFSARPVRVGEKVSHRAINMVLGCITQEIEIDILFHGTQRKSSMICIHKKTKKNATTTTIINVKRINISSNSFFHFYLDHFKLNNKLHRIISV